MSCWWSVCIHINSSGKCHIFSEEHISQWVCKSDVKKIGRGNGALLPLFYFATYNINYLYVCYLLWLAWTFSFKLSLRFPLLILWIHLHNTFLIYSWWSSFMRFPQTAVFCTLHIWCRLHAQISNFLRNSSPVIIYLSSCRCHVQSWVDYLWSYWLQITWQNL